MKIKVINSSALACECWLVQTWGLDACFDCEYLDTDKCGGKEIRKNIFDGKFSVEGIPVEGPKCHWNC